MIWLNTGGFEQYKYDKENPGVIIKILKDDKND